MYSQKYYSSKIKLTIHCLQILLQDRKEHKKNTWYILIDLVKAYDVIKHDVIELH